MFGTMKLFGISFSSRRSRRVLVATTYVLVFLYLFCVVAGGEQHPYSAMAGNFLALMLIVVSRYIFGTVIQNATFDNRRAELQTIGIVPHIEVSAQPPLDEFEVAIRNAAHFRAFKLLAYYSFALAITVIGAFENRSHFASQLSVFMMMGLLVLVFTLPQAVVLWEEPDFID